MNVPIQAKSIIQNNKELLSIWYNGQNVIVPPATRPYFYSRTNLSIKCVKKSTIRKIALSDFQEHTFYKYEFNTIDDLLDNRIDGITFEDNIPFIIRNRIDAPNYYNSFANTDDIIFNFLDIEQDTPSTKLFPTYDDLITSISFASNSRKIKTIFLRTETETDAQLLSTYTKYYFQPDVEVVYNKSYDLPTIYERCKRNNIDINVFSKNNTKPYFGGKHGISIDGTVVYDVLDSTMSDQSLNGNVPNRGLKAVSDYFGFKSTAKVLKGTEITQAKGTKELVEYNKEDVKRLCYLFDIYWPGITYTAEDLGMPLSEVVKLSTTDLGNIVLGDLYREHNIIADGKNEDRYPEIFKRRKLKDEKNYQGAIVDIYQTGLFHHVKKADYSSMYPNILSEFNFSPDTCTLLRYEPYIDEFKIEEDENSFTYYIPDDQIKKVVVIQTKKQKGFLSLAVERFLDERAKFKKEYKKTGSKIAEARSNIAKVKANGGIYGNMGSAKSPYGFVPAAIATCGIGRQCAQILIDVLNDFHPNSVIEVDSVTGDTPVFIRNKKEKLIDIIPIEDLSNGSLREIKSNLETLTRSGWKNLNYVYCHEVNKNIYTLKGYGARIDVTEDHSLFSKGKEVKPSDLVCGDRIDLYEPTDFGTEKESNINESKAWLFGMFLSDGTVTKRTRYIFDDVLNTNELKIVKKDINILKKVGEILEKEYNVKSKIYDIRKSSNVYKIEVIGCNPERKQLVNYFYDVCYCKDKKTKKVPKEILNAPLHIVDAFFDGLTSGDAHIATDKHNYGKWCIDTIFKPFASGITYLLDRKGITYNVFTRRDKPHVTTIYTHKPKKYCSRNVRKQYPGIISKIRVEKKECKVYDLGTDDGTFIAGVGRVICHNTDGVYFATEKINEKKIIETFNNELEKKFKKPLKLGIDIDEYDAGYFHKAKNYVLKKGDTIILHGTAMKSSKKETLSKKLIKDLAVAKLNGESTKDIVHKYLHLNPKDFELSDFAMQTTLGMHPSQYKSNSISYRMAMLAQDHFGMQAKKGNSYHYVKTKDGYQLFQLTKKENIDVDYYKKKLKDVVDMFEGSISSTLSDFGVTTKNGAETIEVEEKTNKTRTIGLDAFL